MATFLMDQDLETPNGTHLQATSSAPRLPSVQDVSRYDPAYGSSLTSVLKIIDATRRDFGSLSTSVRPPRNSVGPMSGESDQMHMTVLSSISEFPSMPRAVGEFSSPWFPSAPYPLTIATISTEPALRT
jgi:hypothetical protein